MNLRFIMRSDFISTLLLFILDRITKFWALSLKDDIGVNQFLTFHLTFNRGVSWGLFDSERSAQFALVSIGIAILTLLVGIYAYQRFNNHYMIIGEILVIAGSISNLIDRYVYKGVIDFILLSYQDWHWPVFNIADCMIVSGVLIMALCALYEK